MYYEVEAKVEVTQGKNPVTEKYLVKATGCSEAEMIVIKMLTADKLDHEVTSSKKSKIRKVLEE